MRCIHGNPKTELWENLVEEERLTVTHLVIPAGQDIPEHFAKADVIVVPVKGKVDFIDTAAGTSEPIEPGDIAKMVPGEQRRRAYGREIPAEIRLAAYTHGEARREARHREAVQNRFSSTWTRMRENRLGEALADIPPTIRPLCAERDGSERLPTRLVHPHACANTYRPRTHIIHGGRIGCQ